MRKIVNDFNCDTQENILVGVTKKEKIQMLLKAKKSY